MKKQLGVLAGLALAVASSAAFAAPGGKTRAAFDVPEGTIGVGVAHNDNGDDALFLPITLGQGLWVEPFLSYRHSETNVSDLDVDALQVGAGLFQNIFTTAKTKAYAGGRLGFTYAEVDSNNALGSSDDSGFLVQPVLGFGYLPVDNLMLGAEAFVTYQDSDIAGAKTFGTGTSLFVRYFFAR